MNFIVIQSESDSFGLLILLNAKVGGRLHARTFSAGLGVTTTAFFYVTQWNMKELPLFSNSHDDTKTVNFPLCCINGTQGTKTRSRRDTKI